MKQQVGGEKYYTLAYCCCCEECLTRVQAREMVQNLGGEAGVMGKGEDGGDAILEGKENRISCRFECYHGLSAFANLIGIISSNY